MTIFPRIIGIVFIVICSSTVMAEEAPHIVGGYQATSIEDPNVRKAAQFATQQINKGTLVKIISAEYQVVAGMNYSMIIEIRAVDGTVNTYKAVVFSPLPVTQKPMELTLWNLQSAKE